MRYNMYCFYVIIKEEVKNTVVRIYILSYRHVLSSNHKNKFMFHKSGPI